MTTLVGLSSGSAPNLTAAELARYTIAVGGTVVDVRLGKGHAWEAHGVEAIRAAGTEVCFLGTGVVLGGPGIPSAPHLPCGLPVRVFAAQGCTAAHQWEQTEKQIQALVRHIGHRSRILIETHHGYADVPELIELSQRAGTGIVLDTMGLARITHDPAAAAARLAPWTSYAQVKGFDAQDSWRHKPLASCAAATYDVLAAAGTLQAVTVESKAGSHADDIALLTRWFTDTSNPEAAA